MRHVLCLVGAHHWEHHVNREMGGKGRHLRPLLEMRPGEEVV